MRKLFPLMIATVIVTMLLSRVEMGYGQSPLPERSPVEPEPTGRVVCQEIDGCPRARPVPEVPSEAELREGKDPAVPTNLLCYGWCDSSGYGYEECYAACGAAYNEPTPTPAPTQRPRSAPTHEEADPYFRLIAVPRPWPLWVDASTGCVVCADGTAYCP